MLDDLQKLGLNRNQANVYYGLLRLGKCTVQELATATGLNRVTVHGIVEQLEGLQLCCMIRRGKTRYVLPLDPVALRFLLRTQAAQLTKQEKVFDRMAPTLRTLYQHPRGKSEVVVLAGDITYEYLIEDWAAKTKENPELLLMNIDLISPQGIELMRRSVFPRKRSRAHPMSMVVPDNRAGHAFIEEYFLKQPDTAPPFIARFLPQQEFHFATHMAIYADTVVLVSFHENAAILLKDEEVRNSMREFFTFVWDRAGAEVTNR
jgi:predicted transcriptional regulator